MYFFISLSLSFSLFLAPPLVSPVSSTSTYVNISSQVVLICSVSGNPLPQVQWTKEDSEGRRVTHNGIVTTLIKNTTTLESTLKLANITEIDNGTYHCTGINNVTNYPGYNERTYFNLFVQGNAITVWEDVIT